jgi:MFS transporter, SET family, sugar efflux transporter
LLSRALSFSRKFWADTEFRVLLLCYLVLGIAYSFVVPFLSLFATRGIGLGPFGLGAFMTVNSLGAITCSTVLARWSDVRFARRSVLLVGGTAGCLGYIGYALLRDVAWLMAVGVGLLGIAAVNFSQLFAYARDLLERRALPAHEVPLYMNVFRLFFALAWTVGPAVAAWVMAVASFRGLFLVAAGFFALFVLLVALFVPHLPKTAAARERAGSRPLADLLRAPGLALHFSAFVLYFACSALGMTNLPLLLVDVLHGDVNDVGIAYSVAPLFELPLMLVMGILAMRIPARRLIHAVLALAVVYYGLLASLQRPWQVFPVQVLSAAIVAVTSGVAITFFQDLVPGQPGSATNLYSNAQRIGSIGGYLSFGLLTEAYGARGVFVCCAGLCAAATALLAFQRPPAPLALAERASS